MMLTKDIRTGFAREFQSVKEEMWKGKRMVRPSGLCGQTIQSAFTIREMDQTNSFARQPSRVSCERFQSCMRDEKGSR